MENPALDVVEILLTAQVYDEETELNENDLPPLVRGVLWDEGGVNRPTTVTEELIQTETGIEEPWEHVSEYMFTDHDSFAGRVKLADTGLAKQWVLENAPERVRANPALAFALEASADIDIDYERAREENRPVQADRAWIDGLLEEYFDDDDEDDADMLDLVEIKAPEEMEMHLDDIVLTDEQEHEITKITKAIEHRDYLAEIGLREIGKLLFVGPPGTAKTSTARGLAHDLDLPFVEVKLSMITSQYLGETAKNVEKVFEVARRLSPCILFIDEFDFVAKTRSSDEHAAIKRAVNTLLKSIDNVSLVQDDVLLIGATNHPDELDSAAWRRFDEILNFPKPDQRMRADILQVITARMDIAEFDPQGIAELTRGMTGSDLRLVLREAVLAALVEERTTLTQDDLEAAVEEFEERDNLKRLDAMSDSDSLIAGNDDPAENGEHDGGGHGHDPAHAHGEHDHDGHAYDGAAEPAEPTPE